MSISNESLPIIAGIITNTARSMTTVMQYIYTCLLYTSDAADEL